MPPKANDGDLFTLVPCVPEDLTIGSIVLVRVGGDDYLHLVTAMDGQRLQIGNNRGRTNGWVGLAAIYGRAVKVEHGQDAVQLGARADARQVARRSGRVANSTSLARCIAPSAPTAPSEPDPRRTSSSEARRVPASVGRRGQSSPAGAHAARARGWPRPRQVRTVDGMRRRPPSQPGTEP